MKTLIILLGPTGVGKTELSLRIAESLHTEILSADSRQLYHDLPIGTAAPTAAQLAHIKHHFVGTLKLEDYYSAAQYESESLALLESLFKSHDHVVMTGGSMMYIDAICKGIDDIPTIPETIREKMIQRLKEEGLETLLKELEKLDPEYYALVDKQNHKRVVHALEIIETAGCTYTSLRKRDKIQGAERTRPFRILKIGLDRPREELFERINLRVEEMLKEGILEEAKNVFPYRELNSLNTVGYKEMFEVLKGNWELRFAIERMKKNTRVYAKKQLTWFRKDTQIHWFHPDKEIEILNLIREF